MSADSKFTPQEVALIRQHAPDMTRIDEAGNIVVLKTREEIRLLQLRYGASMDPTHPNNLPLPKTGDAAQDAARARYPTMFRGKP